MSKTEIKNEFVQLKDKFATKILKDNKEYVVKIILAALKEDETLISDRFEFVDIRINEHLNTKDSTVDLVGKDNLRYYNIELNLRNTKELQNKNFSYIAQLILRDLKPGEKQKYKDVMQVAQINLNAFDFFGKGKNYLHK